VPTPTENVAFANAGRAGVLRWANATDGISYFAAWPTHFDPLWSSTIAPADTPIATVPEPPTAVIAAGGLMTGIVAGLVRQRRARRRPATRPPGRPPGGSRRSRPGPRTSRGREATTGTPGARGRRVLERVRERDRSIEPGECTQSEPAHGGAGLQDAF
jgi:hypothetical protein